MQCKALYDLSRITHISIRSGPNKKVGQPSGTIIVLGAINKRGGKRGLSKREEEESGGEEGGGDGGRERGEGGRGGDGGSLHRITSLSLAT